MTTDITTADGKTVHPGDLVFDYYTLAWGHIDPTGPDDAGWFDVHHLDGGRAYLNGERISTRNLTGIEVPEPELHTPEDWDAMERLGRGESVPNGPGACICGHAKVWHKPRTRDRACERCGCTSFASDAPVPA